MGKVTKMKTKELIQFFESGDIRESSDLVDEIDPKLLPKFQRAVKSLAAVITEVRKTYPDAQYYVEEDTVHLMLGLSHGDGEVEQRRSRGNFKLIATSSGELIGKIGGGGW